MIGATTKGKESSATRGEGAPCGRRVPVTAEVARARMRRLRRAKRRFDHWREKRRAARLWTKACSLRPHIGPERVAPIWTAKRRGTTLESRSREPMRRRLTVRSAYSRTCARRSLNAKSKPWRSGSPGFEIARASVERRAAETPRGLYRGFWEACIFVARLRWKQVQ